MGNNGHDQILGKVLPLPMKIFSCIQLSRLQKLKADPPKPPGGKDARASGKSI
jgi:hypothetical protein